MAKTYYGYKKREGLKPIDYLGATKDLTEGLTGIFEEREKERGLIEEEIREAEKQTKDVPMGDSSTLNEAVLDSSSGAAEALRAQTQLMRNGIIKPSEFTKFKQNVMDGMVDLKEGAVSLNKHITETSAAVEAGTASVAQAKFLEDAMQDTWFDRTRMYTDPKSGHMMIVRTDEKGKDIKGSENSVRNFKNQTKQIIARYDIEKETSSFTETLGEDIRLSMKSGVKTVKDALSKKTIDPVTKKEYTGFDLVNKYVDGASDADLASILVDELSGNYSPTGDVNDKGKAGMVYYEADPTAVNKNSRVPKLTPEQKDAAREYLRANIYAQIDYTETAAATTSGKAPSSAQIEAGKAKEKAKGYVTALQDLFTAEDPKKRTAAMANLAGAIGQDRFISMDMNDTGDVIIFTGIDKDDNVRETKIPLEGTFDDFVKNYGKILTGTGDVWTYYDEVIDSPDASSLTPSVGASGKYEMGFQEDLSQELIPFSTVTKNIEQSLPNYYYTTSEDNRYRQVSKYLDEYKVTSGIEGLKYKRDGNNIVLTLDGLGSVSMNVKQAQAATRDNLKNILLQIHEAATTGKSLEGTTEPPKPDNPQVNTLNATNRNKE